MPLIHGSSPGTVSRNIRELHKGPTFSHTEAKFGKQQADKQTVAIALNEARKAKRAMGGLAPFKPASNNPPFYVRNEARQMHVGPIMSAVPGRTDNHSMSVPSGSYVVPAQAVSHLGQSNTIAGMKVLNNMFGPSGPYGAGTDMKVSQGSGAPRAPRLAGMADRGGQRGEGTGSAVPVMTAGGEYVIPPEVVTRVGRGDMEKGHQILDKWIMKIKEDHIKTLKKLKPPAKS